MNLHKVHWGKVIFWGSITALLYVGLFYYSDLILHFAHTTPDACVVGHGAEAVYYHKADPTACAAKGGLLEKGHWLYAFIPILIAFAISFAHGIFTGLFWDIMGLKPAQPSGAAPVVGHSGAASPQRAVLQKLPVGAPAAGAGRLL